MDLLLTLNVKGCKRVRTFYKTLVEMNNALIIGQSRICESIISELYLGLLVSFDLISLVDGLLEDLEPP